jgi:hypothetical protein
VIKLSPARFRRRATLLVITGFAALLQGAAAQDRSPARIGTVGEGAYGLLWLDVDPARADVALDGSHLDAGVWLISVVPGQHDIRIRKPGYRTHYSRFGIAPGQNLHMEVRLEPGGDDGL